MKKGRTRKGMTREPARRKRPGREDTSQARRTRQAALTHHSECERLRHRLAEVEAELESIKNRQAWVESALADQRHARQVLEAAFSATYHETISRIRDVVRAAIPGDATVLVVSKGDEELLNLDGRRGWHFPQDKTGGYAGYYPADSGEAIEHVRSLIAKGGQYLLFPNTAFWWLEHYREFEEHLGHVHLRIWRDDRCAIYRLRREAGAKPTPMVGTPSDDRAPSGGPTMAPVPARRHSVVCFPIIDWDSRFQRPQQLMSQFAAAGHRVFYLSHEFHHSGEPWALRPIAENLYEVSLRGTRFKVRQGVLDEDSRSALVASLTSLQRGCLAGATVAILQSAFWWPIVREAAATFAWPMVYDCLDHHAGFANNHPLILEQERELLARADLVIASSAALEAEARKRNRNVRLVRNACDYDHFAKIPPKVRSARPVIGYYGAIAEWFDSDLVADLAERRRNWDFVLVGSTLYGDVRRLAELPNVLLPGERPYAEIPEWLAGFDVTILPFKQTPLTEATNPVKAYEILASGRALVSVPLPEMIRLDPLVRLASTPREFEREIEAELRQLDPNLGQKRRLFAKRNTWRRRFETLSRATRRLCAETPVLKSSGRNRTQFPIARAEPKAPGRYRQGGVGHLRNPVLSSKSHHHPRRPSRINS